MLRRTVCSHAFLLCFALALVRNSFFLQLKLIGHPKSLAAGQVCYQKLFDRVENIL
jgi:hypothetical protein